MTASNRMPGRRRSAMGRVLLALQEHARGLPFDVLVNEAQVSPEGLARTLVVLLRDPKLVEARGPRWLAVRENL